MHTVLTFPRVKDFIFLNYLLDSSSYFPGIPHPTLFGSNFAIHKKWLIEVNGFDETFQTPGIGEDADLERRLKMTEVQFHRVTYRAVQFHLWHPRTVVGEPSIQTFEELKKKGNKQALRGLKEFKTELEKSGLLQAEGVN